MSVKIQDILRLILSQVPPLRLTESPTQSGAGLTQSFWAKSIHAYADVPEAFKAFFYPFLTEQRDFPYTVLTPSLEKFIQKTPEKLICDLGCDIYILEKYANTYEVQRFPVEGINLVEFQSALLSSSLKIRGENCSGQQSTATLFFNSVTDYLFMPIVSKIRLAATGLKDGTRKLGSEQFEDLARVNYKFMNYARHSLLGGERVIQSILHPEIRRCMWNFVGFTGYKTISPTHMIILTAFELILIREDLVQKRDDKYGGIWTYIPLNKIMSLSVKETADHLIGLAIQLPEETRFEILFQPSVRDEIDRLLIQFGELTAS